MTWQEHYSGSLINAFGMPLRELVRGEGVHLYDDQGTQYLDLLAGIATASLGHAHPAYVAALADQAATLSQSVAVFKMRAVSVISTMNVL